MFRENLDDPSISMPACSAKVNLLLMSSSPHGIEHDGRHLEVARLHFKQAKLTCFAPSRSCEDFSASKTCLSKRSNSIPIKSLHSINFS